MSFFDFVIIVVIGVFAIFNVIIGDNRGEKRSGGVETSSGLGVQREGQDRAGEREHPRPL